MNCVNETKLSIAEFSEMTRVTHTHINPKITLIGSIFFGIVTFILIILDAFELEGMRFAYVLIPAIITGLFIGLHIYPKTLAKVTAKQNGNVIDGISYKYSFCDDSFTVVTEANGQIGSATIMYSSLYNVVAKKDFMVIYISKVQIYLCKLDGFTDDSAGQCVEKLLQYSKKSKKQAIKTEKK